MRPAASRARARPRRDSAAGCPASRPAPPHPPRILSQPERGREQGINKNGARVDGEEAEKAGIVVALLQEWRVCVLSKCTAKGADCIDACDMRFVEGSRSRAIWRERKQSEGRSQAHSCHALEGLDTTTLLRLRRPAPAAAH